MTFDPTKPVQTRDGRKVEILKTNCMNDCETIIGLIIQNYGHESPMTWMANGRIFEHREQTHGVPGDLINIPRKHWVNMYPPDHMVYVNAYKTRDEADAAAKNTRIACLEFTEGDGL